MWNVGIPDCQSQVQRRIWVSALDRACSRRGGRRPVNAKKPLTYRSWTSLRPVSCLISTFAVHAVLSFGWHLLFQTACSACPEGASSSEETITADATSLIGASSGWQPVMGHTGCCSRYKMLSFVRYGACVYECFQLHSKQCWVTVSVGWKWAVGQWLWVPLRHRSGPHQSQTLTHTLSSELQRAV